MELICFQVSLCLCHDSVHLYRHFCCGYDCDLYILGGGFSENPVEEKIELQMERKCFDLGFKKWIPFEFYSSTRMCI